MSDAEHQLEEPLGGLGARLRAFREDLGLTQSAMAEHLGIPFRSLQDNESSKALPGAKALFRYMLAGADVNWILSGQRVSNTSFTAAEKAKILAAASRILSDS